MCELCNWQHPGILFPSELNMAAVCCTSIDKKQRKFLSRSDRMENWVFLQRHDKSHAQQGVPLKTEPSTKGSLYPVYIFACCFPYSYIQIIVHKRQKTNCQIYVSVPPKGRAEKLGKWHFLKLTAGAGGDTREQKGLLQGLSGILVHWPWYYLYNWRQITKVPLPTYHVLRTLPEGHGMDNGTDHPGEQKDCVHWCLGRWIHFRKQMPTISRHGDR